MPKTNIRKVNFVVAFYKFLTYSLFFFGVIFFLSGFLLSENYFLKFTLNNELTDSALYKIVIFKTFLVISGFIVLTILFFIDYYKKGILRFIARKQNFLQNIILFLSTIFISLVISELAIRVILFGDVKYNFAPGHPEFNEKYVSLNKEGYRDIDHTYNKEKNTTRIAVLGDSYTFGAGIKNINDIYWKKLEKLMNKNSENITYELLNFGKSGIDTEYEISILKNEAHLYKPDIIVVGYVLNDFRDIEKIQEEKLNFYLFWFDKYMERSSYLYYFSKKGFNGVMETFGFKESYYGSIINSFDSKKNKEFNKLYFKELKELSEKNNAILMIVVFPFIYRLDDYPFVNAHNFVIQAGVENDIIVLDLLPYFKIYDETELIVSRFDLHPNEFGHRIAADAIYKRLIKAKIIP